ncbi:MAG: glycosyltransferase family 2 protein [Chloroflexi bacterium]|nr:glycosyltransferase family 2 protein [Chloroflexota bacterium]
MTTGTPGLPPVSAIVLNWNGRPFLEACLASLLAQDYPALDVILVDNASADDSVEFVRRRFPQVRLLCNRQNLGFAGGVNVALRQLAAGVAVLVNPDVVVSPGWLRQLVVPMVADSRIGIAGCKIYFPEERRLQHAGGYVSFPQAIPGHYGYGEQDEGQCDSLQDVEYVTGAAMALRGEMLARVGLFDEGFFLYFEEVDLCRRARQAGYRVVYTPEATAVHAESAVARRGSPAYLRHMHTSRWRFLLKHYPLEDVLQATCPVEASWLPRLDPLERQASARAYQATMFALPEIWATRQAAGQPSPSEADTRAVLVALRRLRQTALSTEPAGLLPELEQNWQVQEQPFTSHVPLLGPAIARLRELWNSVSTKWYVRHLLQQQNEFNALVVRQLVAHNRELAEQTVARPEEEEEWLELAAQLTQLASQVASLEQRLARLEEGE